MDLKGIEGAAREEICEIGRRMWARGFCAGNDGNISVRLSEGRVLCTPTGVSKGFMRPEMMCVVDMEGGDQKQVASSKKQGEGGGKQKEGGTGGTGEKRGASGKEQEEKWKRTSEVLLHLAIYKKRADVGGVIHAHLPCATAFATAGVELPDGVHPEAEFLLGRVPLVEYVRTGKPELGARVAEAVEGDTVGVMLENHGVVCFHGELMETYHRLEVLESYCELLMRLKQLGRVRRMTAQEVRELLELKASYGIEDGRLAAARAGEDVRRASAFLEGLEGGRVGEK